MIDLKDKKILVTGGGGNGLASGICSALDKLGARLILNEIQKDCLYKVRKKYPHAYSIQADITREEEDTAMFDEIESKMGVLDGLVNNAGIGLVKNAHEASDFEFDGLYNVDVKGLWQVSRFYVNHLLRYQHTGNIVNISSIHASRTIHKYGLYASAKSAVEGLTRGMAVELGQYHIRVNSVGPGFVYSDQNEVLLQSLTDDVEKWIEGHIHDYQAVHELMDPENCGNVVAFLLSGKSTGVTGQNIYVDNGTSTLLYNNAFIKK